MIYRATFLKIAGGIVVGLCVGINKSVYAMPAKHVKESMYYKPIRSKIIRNKSFNQRNYKHKRLANLRITNYDLGPKIGPRDRFTELTNSCREYTKEINFIDQGEAAMGMINGAAFQRQSFFI